MGVYSTKNSIWQNKNLFCFILWNIINDLGSVKTLNFFRLFKKFRLSNESIHEFGIQRNKVWFGNFSEVLFKPLQKFGCVKLAYKCVNNFLTFHNHIVTWPSHNISVISQFSRSIPFRFTLIFFINILIIFSTFSLKNFFLINSQFLIFQPYVTFQIILLQKGSL